MADTLLDLAVKDPKRFAAYIVICGGIRPEHFRSSTRAW